MSGDAWRHHHHVPRFSGGRRRGYVRRPLSGRHAGRHGCDVIPTVVESITVESVVELGAEPITVEVMVETVAEAIVIEVVIEVVIEAMVMVVAVEIQEDD
ncbi:hypothetical protein [Trinickia symbiotica]|uniref:hypothetical protein n=1 Tax=Trinickia symbiotica TaxID=863227 RepID=UPI0011B22420|nr:hypothetical protein [Trinickia symbiotica]